MTVAQLYLVVTEKIMVCLATQVMMGIISTGITEGLIKKLFTWGRKILKGGATSCWVYMQKFGLSGSQVEKDREQIKNDGQQKQNCNLCSSVYWP